MSPHFEQTDELDWRVRRVVKYTTERGELTTYSVTLLAWHGDGWQTVRVYDNAHGENEMHRHTLSGGKQRAELFHHGTASEAYLDARRAVEDGYGEMISGW